MFTLSRVCQPLILASAPEDDRLRRLHYIGIPDYVTIDASITLDFITRLVSNISYFIPINTGKLEINQIKTLNGKEFLLLNLPFYLTDSIAEYLKWMISNDKTTQQSK